MARIHVAEARPTARRRRDASPAGLLAAFVAVVALCCLPAASAVKFSLTAHHNPTPKCLWNYAMADTLVVISVSAPIQGNNMQRLDMEVVDGSKSRNTYQSKRGLKGETRMAVTTHADADLGVCFRNVLDPCTSTSDPPRTFTSPNLFLMLPSPNAPQLFPKTRRPSTSA